MYLAYMDESGDPGLNSAVPTYTVGVVLIHASAWVNQFEQLLAFRRYLRRDFGFLMRAEVKGRDLAKGTGPWLSLGLPDRIRKRIYRSFMRLQARGGAIKTYAVVIDKNGPYVANKEQVRERAWRYTFQRIQTFTSQANDTVLLVPDSGQYHWLRELARRMRRVSFVGSLYGNVPMRRDLLNVLIDDPVERDSEQSYFIQLADLNAYAAYRNLRPDPAFPTAMWGELGGAILWEANRRQMERSGRGTSGIVEA